MPIEETKNDEVKNDENNASETQAKNANDNVVENNTQPDAQYASMEDFNSLKVKIDSYDEMFQKILGGIKSIKDAQGVMVKTNGITIQDDSDPEPFAYKPLAELDLNMR